MAENQNHDRLYFNLALLTAGYFLVVKPILEKVGLKEDPKVLATEAGNAAQLAAQVLAATTAQKPTKSVTEWRTIADQIYEDLRYSAFDDNDEDAGYQVCRVQNDADAWVLFHQFKKRQEYWFGVNRGGLKDLKQFITSNLSKKKGCCY
jgi:hypothetical protein